MTGDAHETTARTRRSRLQRSRSARRGRRGCPIGQHAQRADRAVEGPRQQGRPMVAGATAGLRLPLLSRWSADGQPQASAHGAQPHSDPKDAYGSRFASCRGTRHSDVQRCIMLHFCCCTCPPRGPSEDPKVALTRGGAKGTRTLISWLQTSFSALRREHLRLTGGAVIGPRRVLIQQALGSGWGRPEGVPSEPRPARGQDASQGGATDARL